MGSGGMHLSISQRLLEEGLEEVLAIHSSSQGHVHREEEELSTAFPPNLVFRVSGLGLLQQGGWRMQLQLKAKKAWKHSASAIINLRRSLLDCPLSHGATRPDTTLGSEDELQPRTQLRTQNPETL